MKVYQINVVCGQGSTGKIATSISKVIEQNGGQCRIAYGRGGASKDINSFRMTKKIEVYLHAFFARIFDKQGEFSKRATKRLIEDIKEYGPDIIHLHNIHGYYMNYALLFSFLQTYNKPVVWTMHDCWALTGHCAHYESVNCDKWKKECKNCPNLKGYPAAYYGGNVKNNYERKKKIFNNLDKLTIVTPSKWLKTQVEQSYLQEKQTIVIQNGINLNVFKPSVSNLKEKMCPKGKKLLLGATSIWTKNKGLDDFQKLRPILSDDYVICMVGLNEKQMQDLPEGIIGVKRTESVNELAQYYTAADLFLNLTYEDTFPTTNIEAIACGTPVLTYRTGGSPEILDENCGFVVEKGEVSEVAKVVENQVYEKEDYVQYCVDKAKNYNETECYQKYLELYRTILEENA